MYKGPTSHRWLYDFVEDLAQEIEYSRANAKRQVRAPMSTCPYIRVCTAGKMYWSLLDSGSQVSGISENLYRQLIKNGDVYELPVPNVQVAPAVGKRTVPVKKQILLRLKIGEGFCEHICLVIPFLTTAIILGHEFLGKNDVVLDYRNMSISV